MFRVTVSDQHMQIYFSAEMENVEKVDRETELFLVDGGFGEVAFGAHLVMRELVNNSIIHGCKQDPVKRIHYRLGKTENGLEMSIEDEGDGFDWESATATVPDLKDSHGRGMTILNTYCSGIRFNEKGNLVSVDFVKNPL